MSNVKGRIRQKTKNKGDKYKLKQGKGEESISQGG